MLIQCMLLLTTVSSCLSIRCLECTAVSSPDTCDIMTQCQDDSYCFVDQIVTQAGFIKYNLGCRSKQKCMAHKRGVPNEETMLPQRHGRNNKRADLMLCQDCCNSTDFCNNQGCGTTVLPSNQRGPFCFDCNRQTASNACRRITECDQRMACALWRTYDKFFNEYRFTSRCIPATQCMVINATLTYAHAGPVIGKRQTITACCSSDFCNH